MGGLAKEYITKLGRKKYLVGRGVAHILSTSGDALRLVPYIKGENFDEGKPKHLHAGARFSFFINLAHHGRKIKMK
jgi:hypothetical protein